MSFQLFQKEFDDEGVATRTSEMQKTKCMQIEVLRMKSFEWCKEDHINYILEAMKTPSSTRSRAIPSVLTFASYSLNALSCLGMREDPRYPALMDKITKYYQNHIVEDGGYSYFQNDNSSAVIVLMAISAIIMAPEERMLDTVDRNAMYRYLKSMKNENGSFYASLGAESDLRSTYACIIVAKILNLLTPELTKNTVEFTKKCFNFDGGFGPYPGRESHAGFIYCGIGILDVLGALDEIDCYKTIRYIAQRQDSFAGGFNGRTNKLVDSCYTWWIGSSARILCDHLNIPEFWDVDAMSSYILLCAQIHSGGFRDSPPANSDLFHTGYSLAGLCLIGSGKEVGVELPKLDPHIPVPVECMERAIAFYLSKGPISV